MTSSLALQSEESEELIDAEVARPDKNISLNPLAICADFIILRTQKNNQSHKIMNTAVSMTEKQQEAWQRQHQYLDRHGTYKVTIENGRCFGHFNSKCGEYVSEFDFTYNPLEATERDPDWHLSTYTGYKEKPAAHGWLTVEDGDSYSIPPMSHPNELYNWLRDFFGYEKSTFVPW